MLASCAAPSRQLRGFQGEHLSVGRNNEQPRGRVGEEGGPEPVIALERDGAEFGYVPLHGPDPAALRHEHRHGLTLGQRFGQRHSLDVGHLLERVNQCRFTKM